MQHVEQAVAAEMKYACLVRNACLGKNVKCFQTEDTASLFKSLVPYLLFLKASLKDRSKSKQTFLLTRAVDGNKTLRPK